MNNDIQNKIDNAYQDVLDQYKQTLKNNMLAVILSNIGTLLLIICGIFKSTNRLSLIVFVSALFFYILENNYSLYLSNKTYDNVYSLYLKYKEKLKSNSNLEFDFPDQSWKTYIISLVVELVLCIIGYCLL